MKWKVLRSYYSKITMFSLVIVFLLLFLVTGVVVYVLQNSQEAARIKECDTCIEALAREYEEIQENYYNIFFPLLSSSNSDALEAFCESGASGSGRYEAQKNMVPVFREICLVDERIVGVYFYNISDGARYLYSAADKTFVRVDYKLGDEIDATDHFERIVIGARKMKLIDKDVKVFGIQSGALWAGDTKDSLNYQITVLYSLDIFDKILAKYELIPEAHFLLTSSLGEVYYDSHGEYALNEETFYENSGLIAGSRNTFSDNGHVYLKREYFNQDNYLAFYTMPQNSVSFRLGGSSLMVIMIAVAIGVLVTLIMLMLNRLIQRRFQVIECGMEQIGKNRLDYRIPVSEQDDEFTRIAIRFNQMCDDLANAINQNYVYEILRQKAEYKALQGSVNPHFLYNSLEAIREKLLENGEEDCSEMVVLLSRIFEYQIRGDSMVSVRKELGLLETYIEFTSIRYQYGFEYSVEFEDRILDCVIPKLIFQPILENYFVHGFRGDGTDCISIRGYLDEEEDRIHVCFRDNGKGITEEKAAVLRASLAEGEDDSSHIGLRNVNGRLKIVFGEDGYVDVRSNAPENGVCISLIFGRSTKLSFDVGKRGDNDVSSI